MLQIRTNKEQPVRGLMVLFGVCTIFHCFHCPPSTPVLLSIYFDPMRHALTSHSLLCAAESRSSRACVRGVAVEASISLNVY